jgi:predicted peptidase
MALRYLLYSPHPNPSPSGRGASDSDILVPSFSSPQEIEKHEQETPSGIASPRPVSEAAESGAGVKALYPLIIFLHGIGERGDDLELVKKWGLPKYLETGGTLQAYAAAPQCPDNSWWGAQVTELDTMLDALLTSHPIDPERVTLTGFSMGGFGVWEWALHSPSRFAALAPVAGSRFIRQGRALDGDLTALKMPIWAVHSAADQTVPVEPADEMIAYMRSVSADIRYTRYEDADHGQTSDRTFYNMALYDWLLAQRRTAR